MPLHFETLLQQTICNKFLKFRRLMSLVKWVNLKIYSLALLRKPLILHQNTC